MQKFFEQYAKNGRDKSTVYYDPVDEKFIVRSEYDLDPMLEFNKRSQIENAGETGHFKDGPVNAWPIATVPKILIKSNPELFRNPAELAKFLDEHPEYKTRDVGWTRPKKKKLLNRGGAKELIAKN